MFIKDFTCFLLFLAFSNCQASSQIKAESSYTVEKYVAANGTLFPRGIVLDGSGDILVSSNETSGRITAIYEVNNKVTTAVIVDRADLKLNHGIAYKSGYLYASNASTVHRWAYNSGSRIQISSEPEIVINNIPSTVGFKTRTLLIGNNNLLYVSIGASSNTNADSGRAVIHSYNITEITRGGFSFAASTNMFAQGLRNTVGLAFSSGDVLWGVDCGMDNLIRDDLGGDIHNTNPADELIKFDQAQGTNYGFPNCWTVDELKGHQRGEQLSWPHPTGAWTDAQCKVTAANRPPTLPLPAHYAALGITFYDGQGCDKEPGAFPCSMKGDAFIAFHGSRNREPPAGYKVVRIEMNSTTNLPVSDKLHDVISDPNPTQCKDNCFRPVGLVFDKRGHLIVTADATSEIIRIKHKHSSSTALYPGILSLVMGVLALLIKW